VTDFQRARRPEQIEARRAAILDVAAELLAERPIADISLRELSARVGLAKSNVLRYFDSREAIFLEILDRTQKEWLDQLEPALLGIQYGSGPYERETAIASELANRLVANPLLCELLSAMAAVLEKNISIDFARGFKRRAAVNNARFAELIRAQVPELSEEAAALFAGGSIVIVAGLWPYAKPTSAVACVTAEMGGPTADRMFADGVREGLINQLIGLVVRASSAHLSDQKGGSAG
jgi:AcrR family transcriptional regulator